MAEDSMSIVERARLFLMGRRYHYQQVFKGAHSDAVLKDLAEFCCANTSTFHDNERVQSKLDGRREVFLRIAHHLKLSPDQLWQLYDGRQD